MTFPEKKILKCSLSVTNRSLPSYTKSVTECGLIVIDSEFTFLFSL